LWRVLSKKNVFLDVSTIHGGEDFRQKIATEIGKCDATLVLIGERWMAEAPGRGARVWQPDDYVRTEVREALSRPMLVLPVLVSGVEMPKPERLPEDIRPIASKNAMLLRHESFDDDAENILAAILGKGGRDRNWDRSNSVIRTALYVIGGGVAAGLIVIAVALFHFWMLDRSLSESVGTPMTLLIIVCSVILGLWIGLRRARWMG
jgi:hypothetical protein